MEVISHPDRSICPEAISCGRQHSPQDAACKNSSRDIRPPCSCRSATISGCSLAKSSAVCPNRRHGDAPDSMHGKQKGTEQQPPDVRTLMHAPASSSARAHRS